MNDDDEDPDSHNAKKYLNNAERDEGFGLGFLTPS